MQEEGLFFEVLLTITQWANSALLPKIWKVKSAHKRFLWGPLAEPLESMEIEVNKALGDGRFGCQTLF
jgi:hypothetical protein